MKEDYSIQFDEYIKFDRKEAYLQYNDKKNRKVLRGILYAIATIFIISSFVTSISYIFDSDTSLLTVVISYIGFIISLFFLISFDRIFPSDKFRKRLGVFIISTFIFFTGISVITDLYSKDPDSDNQKNEKVEKLNNKEGLNLTINANKDFSFSELVIFFMFGLAFFSFTKNELIQLSTLAYAIPFIAEIIFFRTQSIQSFFIVLLFGALIFVFSYSGQSKRHKQFLARYDYYYKRSYDSLRMKKELDYAREIQLSMLPQTIATIGNISIVAHSEPAMEVGGDYFDYFKISENELGVFICDVSGHGVASALMLSGLRSSMHVILEDSKNPKYIFGKLNRMIRKTRTKKMFVTAIFGVINTSTHKISLFNAGHLPPYKIDGKTGELMKITRHGVTLGALDEIAPETSESEVNIDFNKGDKMIFYTDGLTEAMNKKRDEFGSENIERILYANIEKSPEEILNALLSEVDRFSDGAVQQDDITIMIISGN